MQTASRIEIHFRKRKLILYLILSILFVLAGIWLVNDPPEDFNPVHGNPKVVGYLSILFFGILGIYFFSKMFDRKPAIILDSLGLDDRSGIYPAGFILWQDLESVSIIKIHKHKLIMLQLKDAQTYIQNQRGFIRRFFLKYNYKLYGSPVAISSNALNISIYDLYEQLNKRIPKVESNKY